MSTPSPFEAGRAVSENISGAFQSNRDTTALDEILSKAAQTGQLDDAIGQIISRVSPERQGTALNILQGKQKAIMAQEAFRQKEANKPQKFSPFETEQQKGEAKELVAMPQKLEDYDRKLTDLRKLRDLQEKSRIGRVGKITQPGLRREFDSLRNALTIDRAALQKGNQSDRDMALILGEIGEFGDIGGTKVLDRKIKDAENVLKNTKQKASDLSKKYESQGATQFPAPPVNEPVQQAQDQIFKGQPQAEFVKQDGQKLSVKKGDNKQMIAALNQGYAPEGYVSMMADDGFPFLAPVNEVQNELARGSFIIYGN